MSTRTTVRGRGSFLRDADPAPKNGNPEKKKSALTKVSLQMTPDLYRWLKTQAAQRGVKVYELLHDAVESYRQAHP